MNQHDVSDEFKKNVENISGYYNDSYLIKENPEPSVHWSLPAPTPFDRLPLAVKKFLIAEGNPVVAHSDIFGNNKQIVFNKWRQHSEEELMTAIKQVMISLPFVFETYLELNYGTDND